MEALRNDLQELDDQLHRLPFSTEYKLPAGGKKAKTKNCQQRLIPHAQNPAVLVH